MVESDGPPVPFETTKFTRITLPSMLGSSVAIAVLWRQIFGTDGLVNQVLRLFGVDAHTGWISDPRYALTRSTCCPCGRWARRW